MPAIITVFNPATDPLTCRETCYDNPRPRPHCVCGGRNTGIGLDKAIQSNQKYQKEIAEDLFKRFVYALRVDIVVTDTEPLRNTMSYFSPKGLRPKLCHPAPDL